MGKRELIINGHFEREKKNLKGDYKYTYKCGKCNFYYGSDRKERVPFLCPVCEEKNERTNKRM